MPYRCDFYSDSEYEQACKAQEQQAYEEQKRQEYFKECAYKEYIELSKDSDKKFVGGN